MSLNETPRSNRLHIGIYGKRNSGKSSLINAITGHETALVSDTAGTTTDPVYKSMEVHGLGPCVFIDTAGFDDLDTALGRLRVEQTHKALEKTDIALMVFADMDIASAGKWLTELRHRSTPVVTVVNNSEGAADICAALRYEYGLEPLTVNAKSGQGIEKIREALIRLLPDDIERGLLEGLVKAGDAVLLVMPQDIQAPKGRLILPQVQVMRELLDKKCLVLSVTTDKLTAGLAALQAPPQLIITDSQVFDTVYRLKPADSILTSFSVLYAKYKGDIDYFVQSAASIDRLAPTSHVLIAEACTHAPLTEDIGREKIPRMLRQRVGSELNITVVSGNDFPKDLTPYDLIIQCGSCMFNRKYVLSRVAQARAQGVPMSNYGVVIAFLKGILAKISY